MNVLSSRILRLVSVCLGAAFISAAVNAQSIASDNDPALQQARKILSQLTLEEKISLCHGNSTMSINAIPRVGIKDEFTLSDGPHNVRPELNRHNFSSAGWTNDHSTSLPALSALAATWDVNLAKRLGDVIGREARDRGKDVMLGPGVNIMRTPLCGRNFEYMGEDPVLAAALAVAEIKAVQSHDIAACVKHFAVNSQEWNRYSANSEVDERTLREIYLPAFEAAVKDAQVLSVMNAYNKFRGEFCSESDYLNNRILKGEWKFSGFVVTDWGGLHDTLGGALGGTDVEMNAGNSIRYFKKPLLDAVKAGKIPESIIDDKALRVLYVMAKLHKLDGQPRAPGARNTPEHQRTAREIAEAAIVLLKNNQALLPLQPSALKKVVVLGKNAINQHCDKGWSAEGKPPYEITPLEGICKRLGANVVVSYFPLTTQDVKANISPIPESALRTVDTDVKDAGMTIKAWRAEYFNNTKLDGQPTFTGFDRQLNLSWRKDSPKPGVNRDNFSARWTARIVAPETGTYVLSASSDDGARVFVNNKKIIDNWSAGAFRAATGEVHLVAGQEYEIKAEYFELGGEAAFFLGWEIPSERAFNPEVVKEQARQADAVIIFTGTEHGHGQAMECEGGDRPNMKLPLGHDEAIAGLLALNPRTVIINLSGSPVEMPWEVKADALIQYWYAGQEGGNALASVLFGDVNPSGKLPFTFPAKLEDSPAHALNAYNGTRVEYLEGVFVGYRWFDAKNIQPLFPFGYGLSYTTFAIGKPELSTDTLGSGQSLKVKTTVTNTGKVAGAEVVQLYLADLEAGVPRPPKELKSFRKLFLQPGETQNVEFEITPRDMSFWDVGSNNWKAEPGVFEVLLGNASRGEFQKTSFRLE